MKTLRLTNETLERLDLAITPLLGISRSQVQKAIKSGRVIVDGNPANAHLMVGMANIVTYDDDLLQPEKAPIGDMPKLDILFEDNDVVVVNKPAGLLSHPAPKTHELTLADALLARYPAMKLIGDHTNRAGLVHRLDREASGVLLAAKTPEAFLHCKKQFAARLTKKIYTVLVHGNVKDDEGTITFPIARATTGGRMAARPLSQEGREAVTHYDVLERFPHCTLLDVRIETGRTHQIRAHFFALQHAVAGDTLYAQKGVKPFSLGRLFLHARSLTITLTNGDEKTFTAPLPKELQTFLDGLQKKHRV